ncbi:amidohydrolase [Nocardia colli]|uniref:amidohydrolase n=1 Tax=Nocardia colli TaxID=2545717 RepID=UPI001CC56B7B|nr:amidohydrolase [Nocardia colli]
MPELLFVGGPVYLGGGVITSDPVAVCDGRIRLGAETRADEVIDLRGRMLLPGFQDAHIHAVFGGIELGQCYLGRARTVEACLESLAEYAAANPYRTWIVGSGWCATALRDNTEVGELLDSVVPDRPVYLLSKDREQAWANGMALELAKIDRWLPDPAGGRIDRRPDGAPTGVLEDSAVDLVARLVPELSEAEQLAGLLRAQRMLHELGITGWQDALLGSSGGQSDPGEIYLLAAAAGTLTARVNGALCWDPDRGSEQLGELIARRERLQRGRLQARAVKISPCAAASRSAAPSAAVWRRGVLGADTVGLSQIVTMLDAHDFQVHFHEHDDRAVRECLDAVEAAWKINGDRGNRHHLARLGVVHPDDAERFAAMGAVASMQLSRVGYDPHVDEATMPLLGTQHAASPYPFAELRDSGALLAASSDWPVRSADPLHGIHVAVNRVAQRGVGRTLLEQYRISLADAIDAYTAGSSYVNHADCTGRIANGCYADLVVLDRNPFDYPDVEIADAQVEMTLVEGEIVYAAEGR